MKVVVATDRSETARKAVAWAADLAGRFDGELVLFRATAGSGAAADEPFVDRYDDPMLGWGRRATRGVRVIDIPGGHSSMLQEPHVGVLAEHLQASIDRALGGEPAAA